MDSVRLLPFRCEKQREAIIRSKGSVPDRIPGGIPKENVSLCQSSFMSDAFAIPTYEWLGLTRIAPVKGNGITSLFEPMSNGFGSTSTECLLFVDELRHEFVGNVREFEGFRRWLLHAASPYHSR